LPQGRQSGIEQERRESNDHSLDQIQALQGSLLHTTRQREPFTVVAVDDKRVGIEVGRQKSAHAIHKRQFELASAKGLISPDVIPSQLAKVGIAGGRTAYAAAIIRALF
jgi:hypothetical protein